MGEITEQFEARLHTEKISEAIKMAAVVSICPNRLREHLLNAQRYTTYMELRDVIFTYIEHTQSLTATSMDSGSLQSKGPGKGGGCFECGVWRTASSQRLSQASARRSRSWEMQEQR